MLSQSQTCIISRHATPSYHQEASIKHSATRPTFQQGPGLINSQAHLSYGLSTNEPAVPAIPSAPAAPPPPRAPHAPERLLTHHRSYGVSWALGSSTAKDPCPPTSAQYSQVQLPGVDRASPKRAKGPVRNRFHPQTPSFTGRASPIPSPPLPDTHTPHTPQFSQRKGRPTTCPETAKKGGGHLPAL